MEPMAATKTPTIYLTAFPLGTGSGAVHGSRPGGDVLGCALSEDGTRLAQHLSSSIGFAKHDMGLTSDCKHEQYATYYPDGFTLEWVDDPTTHEGYQAALRLNHLKHPDVESDQPSTVGEIQEA